MPARLNKSIKSVIANQLQKDSQVALQTKILIQKHFKTLHNKLIQEFENHPVTRELKNGASSSNISGTLPNGNLFGFIGFFEGSDPISGIEKLLKKTDIFLKKRSLGTHGFVWTYIVTAPSLNDLYMATPMPWATGLSWLREMEGRGIPNLGQYIYKKSSSGRSGAGLQNNRLQEGGKVKIPYIKTLLNNFEKDLNSIQASRVSKGNF